MTYLKINIERVVWLSLSILTFLACDEQRNTRQTDPLLDSEVTIIDQMLLTDLSESDSTLVDAGESPDDAHPLEDLNLPDAQPPWDPPQGQTAGMFKVRVLLDQHPLPQATITQGGSHKSWVSDENGEAWVDLDREAIAPLMIFAADPQARTKSREVNINQIDGVTIELKSFRRPDQPDYPYSDPGEPERRDTTSQCGHCHLDLNDGWFASPHRSAAKNPIVYDLYTGRGSGHQSQASCDEAGGQWRLGPMEGGQEDQEQCYFSLSALKTFNPSCDIPCDTSTLGDNAYYGSCADCHAPTVNGLVGGGHDLLSVKGRAFEYGIACDFCHHVESVNLEEKAGVGGRLVIQRPRERGSISLGGGGFKPLSFGPHADISNPRMGISPRDHFRDGTLCGACHQHQHTQEHNAPPIDELRWPEGELPNQSTYQEWLESPLGRITDQKIACNSCHMPPLPQVMNSANIEYFTDADIGIQGGWPRPFGETRAHTWWGPRQPDHPLLRLSAHLTLSPIIVSENEDERILTVHATVSNIGAGHGLPTGEPMRHLLLSIDAHCADESLIAVGGDVIHDIGGAQRTRSWAESMTAWPEARVGDTLRVVRPTGLFYDYDGYGAFRDVNADMIRNITEGTRSFIPTEKGLEKEEAVGEVSVIATDNGQLTFNAPLPGQTGDHVYLIHADETTPISYAGHSGFSFARVLTGNQAPPMLPHFVAQDLLRDNRLRPGGSWSSEHLFALSSSCNQPTVTAQLLHRPYPWWLSVERKWPAPDRVIRTVMRTDPEPTIAPSPPSNTHLTHPEHSDIHITLPLGLDIEMLESHFTMVNVQLDDTEIKKATRRAEPWPWQTQRLDREADTTEMLSLTGPLVLFNLSKHPLALEPEEYVNIYGANIDQAPPPQRVLRSSPSQANELWVIPPRSGVLLVPTQHFSSRPTLAAGYTNQGGRSWTGSSQLFAWNALENDADLFTFLASPKPAYINRDALASEPLHLMGRTSLAITYQGSPRADRWHLTSSNLQVTQPQPILISIRNLSASAHPFQVSNRPHQQWTPQGWSDPMSTSWVPIYGETLVLLPALPTGNYPIGAMIEDGLSTMLIVD